MSPRTTNERRASKREHLHLPLQISCAATDRTWVSAFMLDACPSGLQLSMPDHFDLAIGRPVRLRINFTDEQSCHLGLGTIRHIETHKGRQHLGVGLQEKTPIFSRVAMLGISPQILEIKALLSEIDTSSLNILIRGETGTGKNILAKLIHHACRGEQRPFIRVNCPSIPESLFESELFGHEKGAYTDAKNSAPGLFRLADDGTILLDEISEIAPHLQAKLLSVIEERRFTPVGGHKQIPVRANIIATSNLDLEKAVAEGRFRQDLFYRLNELPIHLPPLRERKEDIALLAHYFLIAYSEKFQRPLRMLDSAEIDRLVNHSWPGNVRELENYLKQTALLGKFVGPQTEAAAPPLEHHGDEVALDFISELLQEENPLPELMKKMTQQIERFVIQKELERCDHNRTSAARQLGISYRTLLRKLEHI